MTQRDDPKTRREFLGATVGGFAGLALAACESPAPVDAGPLGGNDSGPPASDAGSDAGPLVDGGPRDCSETTIEIGSRHPPGFRHELVLPMADIAAGTEQTYDITGESRHPHTVLVTAAHFTALQNGEVVEILSSEDMGLDLHDHLVTIVCTGMA